jgi:hypothetical protein
MVNAADLRAATTSRVCRLMFRTTRISMLFTRAADAITSYSRAGSLANVLNLSTFHLPILLVVTHVVMVNNRAIRTPTSSVAIGRQRSMPEFRNLNALYFKPLQIPLDRPSVHPQLTCDLRFRNPDGEQPAHISHGVRGHRKAAHAVCLVIPFFLAIRCTLLPEHLANLPTSL